MPGPGPRTPGPKLPNKPKNLGQVSFVQPLQKSIQIYAQNMDKTAINDRFRPGFYWMGKYCTRPGYQRVLPERLVLYSPYCGISKRLFKILENTPSYIDFETRDFEIDAMNMRELMELHYYLRLPVRDWLRGNRLWLDCFTGGDEELLDYARQEPERIQRPIVIVDDRAVICRPAEIVKTILPDAACEAISDDYINPMLAIKHRIKHGCFQAQEPENQHQYLDFKPDEIKLPSESTTEKTKGFYSNPYDTKEKPDTEIRLDQKKVNFHMNFYKKSRPSEEKGKTDSEQKSRTPLQES